MGFVRAAVKTWKLIVAIAITNAAIPPRQKKESECQCDKQIRQASPLGTAMIEVPR
ncbi:MAG: hypothetical protein ACI9RP_002392 [Cyclobacteriaceae bacterium]|jgi:hypothetical protein